MDLHFPGGYPPPQKKNVMVHCFFVFSCQLNISVTSSLLLKSFWELIWSWNTLLLFYCEGFSNILCECQFIKNVFSDVLNFKRWEPSSFLYNLITYFSYSAPFFIVFILEDSFCYIIYAWMTFTLSKLVINST